MVRMKPIVLLLIVTLLVSCKQAYHRPAGEHDMGDVGDLLYSEQHNRPRALLIFRDDQGWSALSTQCSHDGCDLTYQDQMLVCSCCQSKYDKQGRVVHGPSEEALPFFEIRYKDNHLYANSAKIVDENYRFTTPEIEAAIAALRERVKKEGVRTVVRIPEILLGNAGEKPAPVTSETLDSLEQSRSDLEDIRKKVE